MREGEIRLLQRRALAIDSIEDIHDLIDAEVVPGDLVYRVGVFSNFVEATQAGQVPLYELTTVLVEGFEPFQQRVQPFEQELVDAYPGRVVLHPQLLPKTELLGLHVEVQIEEERLAFVEAGASPLNST